MDSKDCAALVPLRGVKCSLVYARKGLPGAMTCPFLMEQTAERLELAAEILRMNSNIGTVEILVWDAYRTHATQAAIFLAYMDDLACRYPGASKQELLDMTKEFVSSPDGVFPHGTGGAVDVTLLINGREAFMGTGFDEFVPESAPDWYCQLPAKASSDEEAARNRQLLRKAMESAGFVGIANEWWHFEYGTDWWAQVSGSDPMLKTVLPRPLVKGPAASLARFPMRQPLMQSGVAQIFNSQTERAASLAHQQRGHYYARSSHPTTDGLAEFIKARIVPAKEALLCESGLAACLLALKSLIPKGGRLLYDHYIYYEVQRGAMALAKQLGWEAVAVDFTKPETWAERFHPKPGQIDAFYCDSPRNWWLEALDIERISEIAHAYGALLIVDTTLQPLQDVFASGADIAVFSLSKYPSLGFTLGGCLLANDRGLMAKISQIAADEGHVLSPEAAVTIWSHIINLHDHMRSVSYKAENVAAFLRDQQGVRHVRIPDQRYSGGLVGGQLSFHADNAERAHVMEQIIGQNSLAASTCLHLACTFGASFSTFEHFASNIRHRVGIPREETNEAAIPSDLVRLGIGCECVDSIIRELRFLLNMTNKVDMEEGNERQIYSQTGR